MARQTLREESRRDELALVSSCALSVIIHDLYLVGVAFPPLETYAILTVDTDGMLILTRPCQLLKSIAGRNSQIIQSCGRIHHVKFAPRDALDGLPLSNSFIVEEPL